MLILKDFLPKQCIEEALSISSKSTNWKLKSENPSVALQMHLNKAIENVPCRLTTSVNEYPDVKQFLYNQFGKDNFFVEDRIYFSKYEAGTDCARHVDQSAYTIIMLLQKALLGGDLMIEEEKNKKVLLNAGDAVLFTGNSPHFITEVMQGTRIALTLWLSNIPDEYKIKLSEQCTR